jgi:SAM-dependent methyltransferase
VPDYQATTYGERIADVYDELYGRQFEPDATAALLAELAGAGPALELGIGTGRVALPLAERSVEVHGVDASEAMVARLRARPGGDRIPVTIGDFSAIPVEGTFSLVYVVAGTFFELQSQEAQLRCFQSVARRLAPGGVFLLDALVPDTALLSSSSPVRVIPSQPGRLVLRFRELDRARQRYVSHYVIVGEGGLRLLTVPFRFAWPSELDLMARLAGLRLRQRTAGWHGEPFTAASPEHVSIYVHQ